MRYRKLPHGEEQISILGMGTSVVGESSEKNVVETVTYALDQGRIIRLAAVRKDMPFTQGVKRKVWEYLS